MVPHSRLQSVDVSLQTLHAAGPLSQVSNRKCLVIKADTVLYSQAHSRWLLTLRICPTIKTVVSCLDPTKKTFVWPHIETDFLFLARREGSSEYTTASMPGGQTASHPNAQQHASLCNPVTEHKLLRYGCCAVLKEAAHCAARRVGSAPCVQNRKTCACQSRFRGSWARGGTA